jgi:zinc finger SWIM domain-containing protein 3
MTFKSENDAHCFYNSYAKTVGFSVRKCHGNKRANGTLRAKYFVCSSEGQKNSNSTHETKKERASTRSSCEAQVRFYISPEGVWTVTKVVLNHNHTFASPDKTHMLRSHRQLLEADKHIMKHMRAAGIGPSNIFNFFEQWPGGDENVSFLPMDCNNYIGREREKYLQSEDVQTLVRFLNNKQKEDPCFFHSIQLDPEDGRIVNFFWTDGQAIIDYEYFGDVLSVDTTFQTNKFEMPFTPILGTNHHKQTIVFGAALMFDESAESFA